MNDIYDNCKQFRIYLNNFRMVSRFEFDTSTYLFERHPLPLAIFD